MKVDNITVEILDHFYVNIVRYSSLRWKHERTYFSPESRSAALKRLFSCSKEKADQNRTVTMGDLVDVQPSLNCNVTVNNWRKSNALGEQDFEVLTFSPTSIERIDRNEDDPEFCAKGSIWLRVQRVDRYQGSRAVIYCIVILGTPEGQSFVDLYYPSAPEDVAYY